MNALSLNENPWATSSEGIPSINDMLVSCVTSARDTATQHYDAKEIIESIRADKRFLLRGPILKIRKAFADVMASTGGDRKAAKQAVAEHKKRLPGAMWSGSFRSRRSNDPDRLLQHSGLLCADLDELGDRITEVRKGLINSPHLWALFTSPTGDGLKCVFRVLPEPEKHNGSFRAVEQHVRALTGVQIDESCSDVGRLCFLSHDPEVYWNDNAIELSLLVEPIPSRDSVSVASCEPEETKRRVIAVELLGDIDWSTDTRGYCACPGKHLHTTDDKERDCEVYLDGAPTIHCFHNHCRDVVDQVNRELRSRIGKAERSSSYPVNDSERAVRFADNFGADLHYVATWKVWLRWNGNRWSRDEDDGIIRLAQRMPRLLLEEAARIESFEEGKKAATAAMRAGDAARLHAMIELAGAQTGISATPQMFDANPYLLSVKNGVIDLRTACFRQASKEDYLTKQAGTEYVPDARCPRWLEFLSTIFRDDSSLIEFVQMSVGYSLTGVTEEQVLFFLYGTGRNGKSTFTETLQSLLGDYAQHAPAALFVADRYGREPEKEIARLVGSRLVIGSEIEEGAKLAESRVKDLTGQDTLTGRFLYSSAFDFKPTHKLWIFGNHKPDVSGNDLGIWRRMRLVPFSVQIEESKIERRLPAKLIAELPGILNWALQGCLAWQKQGLPIPQAVRAATNEYKDEEDELGEFIVDKCVVSAMAEVTRWELQYAYLEWARERGTKVPMKPKAFAKRLRSRAGISERKSGNDRLWRGISLKYEHDGCFGNGALASSTASRMPTPVSGAFAGGVQAAQTVLAARAEGTWAGK